MSTARYLIGDTREVVASLPTGSVDLVLCSPPFLALRSYLPADHPDKASEIGSEPDPASFIDVMLDLTSEWRRVLAPHGSLAVEFGDTYSGSGGGGDYNDGGLRDGQPAFHGSGWHRLGKRGEQDDQPPNYRKAGTVSDSGSPRRGEWPLAKSLTLVPELYRVALAYGRHPLTGMESPAGRWRVRNVVRWVRPNPPVGALGDKFRPATSDLVIACTASDRYFDLDAVRTPVQHPNQKLPPKMNRTDGKYAGERIPLPAYDASTSAGAPPLDWWQIVPKGYEGSHYATFPPELCVKPIEAMCPRRVCRTCGKPSRRETVADPDDLAINAKVRTIGHGNDSRNDAGASGFTTTTATTTGWSSCGCPGTDGIRLDGFHTGTGWRPGVVLDPFGGTGTTGMVATGHGRDAILIDLDERNGMLARERFSTSRRIVTEQRTMRQRGSWPRRPEFVGATWLTGGPVVVPKGGAKSLVGGEQLHLLDLLGVA